MSDVPDKSIAEIETAVRKAKFDESDTEKFVRDRAHTKARKLAMAKYRDDKLRHAFAAGYREAAKHADKAFTRYAAIMLAALALIVFLRS